MSSALPLLLPLLLPSERQAPGACAGSEWVAPVAPACPCVWRVYNLPDAGEAGKMREGCRGVEA